jgi:hypothetical protein
VLRECTYTVHLVPVSRGGAFSRGINKEYTTVGLVYVGVEVSVALDTQLEQSEIRKKALQVTDVLAQLIVKLEPLFDIGRDLVFVGRCDWRSEEVEEADSVVH